MHEPRFAPDRGRGRSGGPTIPYLKPLRPDTFWNSEVFRLLKGNSVAYTVYFCSVLSFLKRDFSYREMREPSQQGSVRTVNVLSSLRPGFIAGELRSG